MPIRPLLVFSPHAIAVPLAAESVMKESAAIVVVIAWPGNRLISNPRFSVRFRNSSVLIRCGIDMPSPMNKNTYLTGFASAA